MGAMRKTLISILAVLGACGGGGSDLSPREGCEELSSSLCARYYTCFTAAELQAAGFPATEAACVTAYSQMLGCSAVTNENACDGNERYDGEAAGDCVDQVGGLECAQVRDEEFDFELAAPACGRVCVVE